MKRRDEKKEKENERRGESKTADVPCDRYKEGSMPGKFSLLYFLSKAVAIIHLDTFLPSWKLSYMVLPSRAH